MIRNKSIIVLLALTSTLVSLSAGTAFGQASFQGVGSLSDSNFTSQAIGVSSDGAFVVGWTNSPVSLGEAFRWTAAGGMLGLGDLPGGGFCSHAWATSADGAVVVGDACTSASFTEAFRWTAGGGMVGLGDLPGGVFESFAVSTSVGGAVIVGRGTSASGDEAFLWTPDAGMRSLQDLLVTEFGLDLNGWNLTVAVDISDDGQTIVGIGSNPSGFTEGWIAHVPLAFDCNGNGIPDGAEPDCQANGIPDDCDIAEGTSADCNLNGIPEECESFSDCNANAIPDECDIARGLSADCNVNGVADECESVNCPAGLDSISVNGGGMLSTAGLYTLMASTAQPGGVGIITAGPYELADGFWHTLSSQPPSPPLAEPFGGANCTLDSECLNTASCIGGRCYVPKNRYVSIDANPENAGKLTARRLALDTNTNGVFDEDVDVLLGWMGEPFSVTVTGPEPSPQWQSLVAAAPFFADWVAVGAGNQTVHLGDCHISPVRAYVVQSIFEGQDISVESNYSDPLALPTVGVWGDVAGGGNPAAPPDTSPNVGDIQAVVLGFQALQSAPKVWLDLEGLGTPNNVPDFGTINIADVQRAVQGFQAVAYPFSDPCTCAGLAPCP